MALDPSLLLLLAAAAVLLVVVLVTWLRLPAFVALLIGSVVVGAGSGMPLLEIPRAFQQGVGDTLGFVALVIGLGTVIGKLLTESGGAGVVARALVSALGVRWLDLALLLSGFLIGLPVFFQVGLVLLVPVLYTAQRQTGQSMVRLGIPMVAGLSAAHGLVPPHPGPLAAIERLGADTGRTILYAVIVALPLAVAAGLAVGRIAGRRLQVAPGALAEELAAETTAARPPSLPTTLVTILAPVALMLLASLGQAVLADGPVRRAADFAGSPLVAMLLATLLAFLTFGRSRGFTRVELLRFAESSLPPIASVLLVVGAGGGFGRVLVAAGVDRAIAGAAAGFELSPLVLGWVIAALLRLAVGSATVSVVTAASIMAPLLTGAPAVSRELLVVSIGAGSLIASHVNDGGFWLVKEYLNLTVAETLASWTVLETLLSIGGLIGVLALQWLVA